MTDSILNWPAKYDVLGVRVSCTDYHATIQAIVLAAKASQSAIVSMQAVHPIVLASQDNELREIVNEFDIVAPDGQPVRWALNWLHNLNLSERVYGPELMWRLCERAASENLSVYFYGSTANVLEQMQNRLKASFPNLHISGAESPPFRDLGNEELDDVVKRINGSKAKVVFIGLGAPKQDQFAALIRADVDAVLVCVGAAFDFHAGAKPMAPNWMQRRGLEWLFRFCSEPRRLWKRYLTTNSVFVLKLTHALVGRRCRNLFLSTSTPQSKKA
ncbi:MAG: WecB/TagA/CpsF family glycosyltransferase [Planctomycetota bacterium]